MDSAVTDGWQEWVEGRVRSTLSEIAAEMESRANHRVGAATERAQRECWENMNQQVRNLRRAESRTAVLTTLVESLPAVAKRLAVFSFDAQTARAEAQRNLGGETLSFPLNEAAAFLTALETRDPVVAAPVAREISPILAGALEEAAGKIYLFPVLVRQQTAAILFGAGVTQPAALEVLAEAGGMCLELLELNQGVQQSKAAASTSNPLVQLSGGTRPSTSWETLSAADQQVHLRAQRVARVKVAELRLANVPKIRQAVNAADVYGALQGEIDALRNQFREEFVRVTNTMVDYLHLELVRSLANHDERLLGPKYPGPLV